MKGSIRRLFKLSSTGLIALLASQVYASGYKMEFQSVSVLADGGDAAVVEDAGTNWYNSAGLVYLPQQFVASAIGLYEQVRFGGTSTAPNFFGGAPFVGSGNATAYTNVGLPGFHYSLPFRNRYAFGISIAPSWGLSFDYGDHSIVRYDLVRVYTKSLQVTPSLAMQVTDKFSVGIGPDFSYWTIQQKNHARTEGLTLQDSVARISTDNWGYGGHIGLLYRFSDVTRAGLNYRSKIMQPQKGYSDFQLTGINTFEANNFNVSLPQPAVTSLSVYHDMTPCWALMGTVEYDQWSVIKVAKGVNYMTPTGVATTIVFPAYYNNTFDLTAGTHYKLNDKWMLRGSLKFQQTPTKNAYRDINFPDGEKLGINLGAHYQITKKTGLDLIYAHVFARTVPINITEPLTAVTTNGYSRSSVDLAGAQLVFDI